MTADHDAVFLAAVAAGCRPFWHFGIVGEAWHCGCPENGETHYINQQCSVVRFYANQGITIFQGQAFQKGK